MKEFATNTPASGAPKPEAKKKGFDWQLIRRFVSYQWRYRNQVIIGAVAVPITIAFSVLFPWLIMHIIDTQVVPGHVDGLYWWCGLLLLVLVGNYCSDALFSYFLQKSALHALRDMRGDWRR